MRYICLFGCFSNIFLIKYRIDKMKNIKSIIDRLIIDGGVR